MQTLLQFSGERHVIISCFDSDACVMLKKKQNRFPVLFLTQGQSLKYPPYKDFRFGELSRADIATNVAIFIIVSLRKEN